MLLERLQHMLRIEARVAIIEPGHEAERDEVVFRTAALRTIDPRSAVFFRGQRIAHRVDDFARLNAARRDFPQLFHSHAIRLRVAVFHQVELLDELLGERSASAFGEHDDLRLHVVARLEIRFPLILFVDALVVGAHADDATRRLPSKSSSDPANPVKIVIPASSTLPASHFTKRLIEMT